MSIEGITNYEHGNYEYMRPSWERLERMDYCEQYTSSDAKTWLKKIREIFRRK